MRLQATTVNSGLKSNVTPAHDVLVINMDADLYSSTIYVLNHLRPHIKPGTLIYFDEMNHVDHEPRAFDQFTSQNSRKFRPFALTGCSLT
jgi:hypothetical protein